MLLMNTENHINVDMNGHMLRTACLFYVILKARTLTTASYHRARFTVNEANVSN